MASFATTSLDVVSPKPESRHDVLLESLKKYYASPDHLEKLTNILRSDKAKVSLRTIDWLTTNYSKKHNVVYALGRERRPFNMYLSYKSCLKAWSKKAFDPFQRRARVTIPDTRGQPLESTVGQLNFFRWALKCGVVEYAQTHAAAIEADMLEAIKHRGAAVKTKRKELSRAAVRSATTTHINVQVQFV